MKVHDFFKLLEKANEFKKLCGEQSARVMVYENAEFGYATSYKEFKKIVTDIYHPEATKAILEADIKLTSADREFKIRYHFEEYTYVLNLFVE